MFVEEALSELWDDGNACFFTGFKLAVVLFVSRGGFAIYLELVGLHGDDCHFGLEFLQSDFSLDLGFNFVVDSEKDLRFLFDVVFVGGTGGDNLQLILDLISELLE